MRAGAAAPDAVEFTAADEGADEGAIDGHEAAFQEYFVRRQTGFELADFQGEGDCAALMRYHGVGIEQGRMGHRRILGHLDVVSEQMGEAFPSRERRKRVISNPVWVSSPCLATTPPSPGRI